MEKTFRTPVVGALTCGRNLKKEKRKKRKKENSAGKKNCCFSSSDRLFPVFSVLLRDGTYENGRRRISIGLVRCWAVWALRRRRSPAKRNGDGTRLGSTLGCGASVYCLIYTYRGPGARVSPASPIVLTRAPLGRATCRAVFPPVKVAPTVPADCSRRRARLAYDAGDARNVAHTIRTTCLLPSTPLLVARRFRIIRQRKKAIPYPDLWDRPIALNARNTYIIYIYYYYTEPTVRKSRVLYNMKRRTNIVI